MEAVKYSLCFPFRWKNYINKLIVNFMPSLVLKCFSKHVESGIKTLNNYNDLLFGI